MNHEDGNFNDDDNEDVGDDEVPVEDVHHSRVEVGHQDLDSLVRLAAAHCTLTNISDQQYHNLLRQHAIFSKSRGFKDKYQISHSEQSAGQLFVVGYLSRGLSV